MSGKKEDGWIECSRCKKYFPKKSLNQHENACTLSEKDVNDRSFPKSQSGYIDKGMFFGKISKRAMQKSMLTSCLTICQSILSNWLIDC